jgi:uncharacterized cupin superfamily protein
MSHYTIKNFKADVEDQAPRFGLGENIEARFGREPLGCQKLGVSYMRLAPGFRLPFGHKHAEQEEVYVVLSGSGRARIEDEVVELAVWDAVRVGPETMRGFEAGPDGLELLIVGAPRVAQPDSELVQGWWTD